MPAIYEAAGAELLKGVTVSGVGDVDEDQAARAGAQSSATYEQQMELLQRQLFRLSAEKQARLSKQQQQEHQQEPGQASNVTVVRAPQADDRSSESEPDTDDEEAWDEAEEGGADAAAADEASTAVRQKGVLVHFQNRNGQWLSVFRDILPSRGVGVTDDQVQRELEGLAQDSRPWAFLMCAGGHFAAAVIAQGQVVKHKGFHRYVIRAKRGTVQSAHDKKGGAPKSAGATLRRYNEQQLERDIHDLLHDWRQLLTSCALIFHRTSVNNRGFVFLSRAAAQKSNAKDSPLLEYSDPRVRAIPFPTGRPTLKEITRTYARLVSLEPSAEEPKALREQRLQAEAAAAAATSKAIASGGAESGHDRAAENIKDEQSSHEAADSSTRMLLTSAAKNRLGPLSHLLNMPPPLKSDEPLDIAFAFPSPVQDHGLDLAHLVDEDGNTALHIAAEKGHEMVVQILLAAGANPEIFNAKGKTAYERAKSKEVRNVFRRFMAVKPQAWNYETARIPSALTREAESEQLKKKLQQDKAREQRQQQQAAKQQGSQPQASSNASTAPVTPAVRMSATAAAREQRAAAALARLHLSGSGGADQTSATSAAGGAGNANAAVVPDWKGPFCVYCGAPAGVGKNMVFRRLDYEYCSMACLRTHKDSLAR